MASYTRQSTFGDGDLITAALFNNEYNQLVDAFSNTTGHKHDGTVGEGPVIGIIGDAGVVTPLNKILVDSTNDHIEFWIDVSGTSTQQFYIADGAIVPVTDNDIDLGSNSLQFKDLYINGTANIDSLVADTADINGGTIDGVTIGASSAGAITGTTITATSFVIGNANITETELEILDGATLTTTELNYVDGVTSSIQTQINTKAPLASPSLTGIPTAPTAASNTNTTQVATTAYVQTEITDLIDAAPGTLDTLNELAAAINDDANYNSTLTTALATKLPLAGGTMTGNVTYSDNVKAQFGTSQDLQIYHDGSNSFIKDAGTGNLNIIANELAIYEGNGTDLMIGATPNGAVTLSHNAQTKLATTSTGIDVTGVITTDGLTTSADINFGDNDKAVFGAGGDLEIYHDGSHSYVRNTVTGNLYIRNLSDDKDIILQSDDGAGGLANYVQVDGSNGEVRLSHYGSEKFNTTSTGIDVTGTVVSDGLTVEGDATIKGGSDVSNTGATLQLESTETQAVGSGASISFKGDDGSGAQRVFGVIKGSKTSATSGEFNGGLDFFTRVTAEGNARKRLAIASNGDISFYEDTGSTAKLFWDSSAESLGIGTSSPSSTLEVNAPASNGIRISSTAPYLFFNDTDTAHGYDGSISQSGTTLYVGGATPAQGIVFRNKASFGESARLDTLGNLLVGTTSIAPYASTSSTAQGISLRGDLGFIGVSRPNNSSAYFNRAGNDGSIIDLRKSGVSIGSIGTNNDDLLIYSTATGHKGLRFAGGEILPVSNAGALEDNTTDLGSTAYRFKNLQLSGTANFGSLSDGTITITGFVDEDNMATNSATLVPTQQSVKAYVDSQVSSAGGNGISFEDNEKAQFGASNDLQIYHDGSHSYIEDAGTGDLIVKGASIEITTGAGNKYFRGAANIARLYHTNNEKLATTSSGVNVTGTVTSDGLTVGDSHTIGDDSFDNLVIASSTAENIILNANDAGVTVKGDTKFLVETEFGTDRFKVDTSTGDISFYDNTGSTQALFWDSSAESLCLGNTSAGAKLDIRQDSGFAIRCENGSGHYFRVAAGGATEIGGNVDVTGRVTADGLTSEGSLGNWAIQDNGYIQTFSRAGTNYIRASDSSGILRFDTGGTTIRQKIAANGDISFYDDTGSTQGLFWDASAERLGIGTTSPSEKLTVAGIVKSNGFSTNTAGVSNFIAGVNAGSSIISGGEYNTLIGDEAGASITTGDFNVAVGTFSLDANTTAGENTAIGYASLSNNITGARNVASGFRALQLNTAANDNTATGYFSLYSTTGSNNTAIGKDAGKNITTGSKNTIIGSFDGNEGGLDIRTANNHIVLSDGDGNPRQVIDSSGNATFSGTVTSDGLTVNSDTILLDSGSSAFMKIDRGSNSTFGIARYYTAGVEDWRLGTINDSTSNFYLQDASSIKRFQVATNGDISFYEDTGTTQALFWDSSAERLGIGTTSPSAALHISGTSADQIRLERANHDTFRIGLQSAVGLGFHNVTDNRTDMMIKGDGSVGIGTSSPSSSKLTVQGDIRIRDSIASLFLQDTEGTNQVSEIKQSAGVTTISSRNNTSNGAILFTGYNGSATTEYARFNSSGRLGIGTTSPDYALDIRDDSNIQLKLSSTTTTNNARIAYAINNQQKWSHGVQASDNSFTFYDVVNNLSPFKIEQGAANNTLVVDSNSRVGIGINNPSTLLHLQSTDPTITLTDTSLSGNCNHQIRGADQFLQLSADTGNSQAGSVIKFSVDGSERARIDSSGRLGIGTTSPDALLEIDKGSEGEYLRVGGDNASNARSLRFTSSTASGSSVGALHTIKANSVGGEIAFANGNGNIMYLDVNRKVGIGTTAPGEKLTVSGNTLTYGSTGNVGAGASYFLGNSQNSRDIALTRVDSATLAIGYYSGGWQESARFDSSGNLLVGTTNTFPPSDTGNEGVAVKPDNIAISRNASTPLFLDRMTSDGTIVDFRKDNTTVGNIGTTAGDLLIGTGEVNIRFDDGSDSIVPRTSSGSGRHNAIDLGLDTVRFKDLYLSGTANTGGLSVNSGTTDTVATFQSTDQFADIKLQDSGGSSFIRQSNGSLIFEADRDNAASGTGILFKIDNGNVGRFDTSGNLLVGKTSANIGTVGHQLLSDSGGDYAAHTSNGTRALLLNRLTSDGEIIDLRKDGTTVGSIKSRSGDLIIHTGITGLRFNDGNDAIHPVIVSGSVSDGATDLGLSNARFKDLHLSGIANVGALTASYDKTNASTPIIIANDTQADTGQYIAMQLSGSTYANIGIPQTVGYHCYIASGNSSTTGYGLKFSDYIVKQAVPCRGDGSEVDNVMDLGNSSARFDDIYATNGTIQTSDRNDKQDIQALTDAETRVATACKGLLRRFRWQDAVTEKGDEARYHFGIISQDLQSAFTAEGLDAGDYGMFISQTWEDSEGVEQTRLGVRYSELLAFIIAAI